MKKIILIVSVSLLSSCSFIQNNDNSLNSTKTISDTQDEINTDTEKGSGTNLKNIFNIDEGDIDDVDFSETGWEDVNENDLITGLDIIDTGYGTPKDKDEDSEK